MKNFVTKNKYEGNFSYIKTRKRDKNEFISYDDIFDNIFNKISKFDKGKDKLSLLPKEKLYLEILKEIHIKKQVKIENYILGSSCIPGNDKAYVAQGGNIFVCEKSDERFPIGTVKTGIKKSQSKQLIKKFIDFKLTSCKKCWAIRFCNMCYASFEYDNNTDMFQKNASCRQLYRFLNL